MYLLQIRFSLVNDILNLYRYEYIYLLWIHALHDFSVMVEIFFRCISKLSFKVILHQLWWRIFFPDNSIWNTAVPLLSYSCMFQVEICSQQLEICKSMCMFIVFVICSDCTGSYRSTNIRSQPERPPSYERKIQTYDRKTQTYNREIQTYEQVRNKLGK